MFKTLRSRLIISHVLPFVIIIPLIGLALVYFLETQFLLPQLSVELTVDARFLADLVRNQPELLQDPQLAEKILQSYGQATDASLMFFNPTGQPISYKDINGNSPNLYLTTYDLQEVQTGQIVTRVQSQNFQPVREIEVLAPVIGLNQNMIGVVRLSYSFDSVLQRLLRLRTWIISIAVLGLVLGITLGAFLAVTISRPIRQATEAVNHLAQGNFDERLPVKDPLEIRQLSEAVNYLVDRLQNLENARQKLLANLVHEIGRPLGALRTAIHALRKGASENPQLMSDLLTGMDEETSRLERLLDDLNGLYDEVLGSLELDLDDLELNDWLPATLAPWQESAYEKGLHWEMDVQAGLPVIQADHLRLGQALGNLASNAIKFTPAGGTIQFIASYEDHEILLSFQDNGPGVILDEQDKIFQPFYQGETGRRIKEGMGLGLSIARDLVIAHGGSLEVSSQLGQGSQFTIHLPVRNQDS